MGARTSGELEHLNIGAPRMTPHGARSSEANQRWIDR